MDVDMLSIVRSAIPQCDEIKTNFDSKSISKINKANKIDESENLIAYVSDCGIFGKTVQSIAVTDIAIYGISPSFRLLEKKNVIRIPLHSFAKYIISNSHYTTGKYEYVVELFSSESDIHTSLWASRRGNKDSYAKENLIHNFLISLLSSILENCPHSRILHDDFSAGIINKASNIIHNSSHLQMLPNAVKLSLIGICQFPYHRFQAAELLAYYFSICFDPVSYESSIEKFCGNPVPSSKFFNDCMQLKNARADYIKEFLSKLEDPSITPETSYLDYIYKNLSNFTTNADGLSWLTIGNISLYIGKEDECSNAISQLEHFPEYHDETRKLILRYSVTQNQKMLSVLNSIESGEYTSNEICHDAIGLTAMHYAIILKKYDLIERFCNDNYAIQYENPLDENELTTYLDYSVVCNLVCPQKVAQIILHSKKDAVVLLKTRKHLILKLKFWQKSYDMANEICTAAKRNMYYCEDDEQLDRLESNLEISQENMEKLQDLIDDTQALLQDIEQEIDTYLNTEIEKIEILTHKFENSSDPTICFYRKVCQEPTFLRTILTEPIEKMEIYHFGSFRFIAPSDLGLLSSEWSNTNERSNYPPVEKPYGSHWFSSQAYRDLKILHKEYLKLAKEYHPDVSTYPFSQQVFQEILQERETIIENFHD